MATSLNIDPESTGKVATDATARTRPHTTHHQAPLAQTASAEST